MMRIILNKSFNNKYYFKYKDFFLNKMMQIKIVYNNAFILHAQCLF